MFQPQTLKHKFKMYTTCTKALISSDKFQKYAMGKME